MVELQQYTMFDEVCVLAHKMEQQRKKNSYKHDYPQPSGQNQPFNKGSSNPTPRPIAQTTPTPQKAQTPQKAYSPQTYPNPNPNPMSARRCFKCQGLGHIASDYPNRKL